MKAQDENFDALNEPKRRRRSAPWLLGGLVVLLLSVLVVLQVFGLWEVFTPDTASDTLLLYALSSLNFAAFIVFTFIFVRNLLKLRRERRERQLGSKIKTRLVVYFITLSLLPITGMAVFSYIFFNRSLEKWFSSLPEEVVNEARRAQEDEQARQLKNLGETLSTLAVVVNGQANGVGYALPPSILEKAQLSMLAIVGAGDAENGFDGGATASDLDVNIGVELLKRATTPNRERDVATFGARVFDIQWVALDGNRRLVGAKERHIDESLRRLIASAERFENFKRRQRKVRLLGLSTLGLLTLLLLFAASWSAIHLARGIATPIRALAEAADEVAGGNLEHRVTAIADDELALLAASFNQMTAQLQENRRRIETGAAELREKHLALAERRDYIETVLASLSTGVVSLDEDDRVTTINPAALLMLRLDTVPQTGTPLAGLVGAGDIAVLERILRRARLRGRAAEQLELARGSSLDGGATIPVALTAIALSSPQANEKRGVVLVMEDLSELLAAQRAAAWSEVARRMAHEIKNPLTPIQLSAERIARSFRRNGFDATNTTGDGNGAANGDHQRNVPAGARSVENDAPERERVARVVEECTATITREVAGLKAMVDEFSRFARLPHARLEPADLNEVARQAVALYEERMGDVRLDVRLAHELPTTLLDAEQLRRVFVNLIDNALESLADDAEGERRVTVATGHDPARGILLAEVADTGHGVSRADFPHLFQPYFSTRGRGTGLGLAIVQRIIAEHGGRIRAEANRPRGARFIFELPVADEAKTN
jgi:nitrogen fixation/metabolism regulation signal transduction histidine kinase